MLASMLRALSSASATAVNPLATNALDFGMGAAPELMASTSDCTLRKLTRVASLGMNNSGELKEEGDKEKKGTCREEDPLI
jgi:hypothetical protein